MVAAIGLGRVPDHLVAEPRVEVHVDVGHRDAAGVEEALEQQVVLDGVEVGDAQAVRHCASGGRTTARTHPDAATLGVGDEVADDEEIAGEPHVLDGEQLVRDPFDDGVGQRVAPALLGTLPGEVLEIGGVVGELGGPLREVGQLGFAEFDGDVGAFGDPQRVVAGFGHVAEQVAHLGGRLEVVLGAFELEPLRVAEQRAGLHAQQRVVRLVVVAVGVVRVVGGQQGRTDAVGDLDELGVGVALCCEPMVLDLDEQMVLAEDLLQTAGFVERTFLVAVQQRLQHVSAQAAGGGDETVVVLLEQLPVDLRLVVVALEEGQTRQLDEVAVPLVGLGQQREVVVELLAAVGLAARVVDPTAPYRTLGPVLERHVRLGADDGLHALGPALLVEVEGAVHVAVIGDADGRLAVADRLRHQFVEPCRAIEHRELGVHVQVGERVAHIGSFRRRSGATAAARAGRSHECDSSDPSRVGPALPPGVPTGHGGGAAGAVQR